MGGPWDFDTFQEKKKERANSKYGKTYYNWVMNSVGILLNKKSGD